MKRLTVIIICAIVTLAGAASAVSQEQEKSRARRSMAEAVFADGFAASQVIIPGDREVHFLGAEMSFGGKLVKGAPYSAEAVTESIQALADGNRIVRKSAAMVYRDSEGRTRHEQTLRSVGPYAVAGDPPQMIFINDPVAGAHYILEPRGRTVRKMGMPRKKTSGDGADVKVWVEPSSDAAAEAHHRDAAEKIVVESMAASGARMRRPAPPVVAGTIRAEGGDITLDEPKTESLGKQMIEGVEAEGTRTTVTIPAGKIGNEMPILIISERWYSPELQLVVMTRHSDPRFGEQSYRLTNINRSEPAKTLFEIPSDYTIKETVPSEMRMKIERELQRSTRKPNEQ
jgi:hypothetical protein